jgi:hypothetical protein
MARALGLPSGKRPTSAQFRDLAVALAHAFDHGGVAYLTSDAGQYHVGDPFLFAEKALQALSREASAAVVGEAASVRARPSAAALQYRCPGVIDTDFPGDDRSALDGWVNNHVPMQRLGERNEVAQVVRFLVRDAPTYASGARLAVDGATEGRA